VSPSRPPCIESGPRRRRGFGSIGAIAGCRREASNEYQRENRSCRPVADARSRGTVPTQRAGAGDAGGCNRAVATDGQQRIRVERRCGRRLLRALGERAGDANGDAHADPMVDAFGADSNRGLSGHSYVLHTCSVKNGFQPLFGMTETQVSELSFRGAAEPRNTMPDGSVMVIWH